MYFDCFWLDEFIDFNKNISLYDLRMQSGNYDNSVLPPLDIVGISLGREGEENQTYEFLKNYKELKQASLAVFEYFPALPSLPKNQNAKSCSNVSDFEPIYYSIRQNQTPCSS